MAAPNQTERNPFTNKAYSANFFVLRKMTQTLPVFQQIPRLLSSIQQHNVVVVVGETDSGKTTQLPKAILQADAEINKPAGKKLALTQNRRLAAQLVAERIIQQRVGRLQRMPQRWSLTEDDTARFGYCTGVPEGHIKDGLVKVLAKMTDKPEAYFRGGMSAPTAPTSTE